VTRDECAFSASDLEPNRLDPCRCVLLGADRCCSGGLAFDHASDSIPGPAGRHIRIDVALLQCLEHPERRQGHGLLGRDVLYGARGGAPSGGGSKFTAWLFRDMLLARLFEEANVVTDDAPGIDAASRSLAVEHLEAEILALERQEESLVEAAIAQGIEVHRRSNASALAILGLTRDPGVAAMELPMVAAE
jgi:hypothetical protein